MNYELFFKDLANLVFYHRKQAKLNRKELADLAGVGKTVIYNIEHGKQTIQFNTILKIFNVLNIKIEFTSPLMHYSCHKTLKAE